MLDKISALFGSLVARNSNTSRIGAIQGALKRGENFDASSILELTIFSVS